MVYSLILLNRAFYEIMWKNIMQTDRAQMTIWRLSIACWIPKSTYTHSEYVTLLFHCDSGCTNTSQCYVPRVLPALFVFIFYTIHIFAYMASDDMMSSEL
jgi:hypothetical protein